MRKGNGRNRSFGSIELLYPGGEADVVDQREHVVGAEIKEREESDAEDGRRGGHARHLDHGQNLRHLALHGSSVEQPDGKGPSSSSWHQIKIPFPTLKGLI